MKTYFIHDNGCRPFKVIIDNSNNKNKITVYQLIRNSPGGENDYNMDQPVLNGIYEKLFIGESNSNKTTRYSGGHGPNFKGNTILFKPLNNESDAEAGVNKYIFIGDTIFSFTALDEIVKYDSTVGNSDVSYPSAMDKSGNIYLLIEDVIISNLVQRKNLATIYDYYYSNNELKKTFIVSDHIPTVTELKEEVFDTYCMKYDVHSEKLYNRMTENDDTIQRVTQNKIYLLNNYKYSSVGTSIERNLDNVTFTELSKDKFIEMMEHFGLENGFQSVKDKQILCERIW